MVEEKQTSGIKRRMQMTINRNLLLVHDTLSLTAIMSPFDFDLIYSAVITD